jgi:hypothetical protein
MRRQAGRLPASDELPDFGFWIARKSKIQSPKSKMKARLSPVVKAGVLKHDLDPTPQAQTALQPVSACVRFAEFNENREPIEEHGYSGFS